MSIDNIVEEDEGSIEFQLSELRKRKDFYNPQLWIKNKKLLNKYREQCVEELVQEYSWPKNIAKQISKFIHPPSENMTTADYAIGYFAGSLPKLYLGPIAKIRGKDITKYTKVSIITDAILLGVSAFAIYGMHSEQNSEFATKIYDFLRTDGAAALIYANAATRAIQIYTRTRAYLKGNHTWSPATIINPFLPEIIAFTPLMVYDQVKKIKDYKNKFLDHKTKLFDIIRDKRYRQVIMD